MKKLRQMKILGASLVGAAVLFFGGIVAWGGFNTAMEATNTTGFCITCHEMYDNVYQEYKQTTHYSNRTGVRASCSDCHVPDPWVWKFVRKIQATAELYHWALGSIDTKEKFEGKRLTLAKYVWRTMKKTDSRECRNCHSWESMAEAGQKRRAWKQHQLAQSEGQTCIDCHKGIAHRPVHTLLGEDDDPYDGLPDSRSLPVEVAAVETQSDAAADPAPETETETAAEASETAEQASAATEQTAPTQTAAAGGGLDWSGVEGRTITLFYPGQASLEWVLKGSDHGGARAITKIGDRCAECHEGEQADMGQRLVTGEKAETQVIPSKRAAIEVEVKAAHDAEALHLHFAWPDTEHAPVPFVDGGKMDPDNQVKLAIMLIPEANEFATQVGCWASCHHDSRYMPDHPEAAAIEAAGDLKQRLAADEGVTKYLRETRSDIEIRGTDGAPRGGWDKLLPADQVAALLTESQFIDLVRFKSGPATTENGYVLERRVVDGGAEVSGTGALNDGTWQVTLAIPLASGQPGDLALDPSATYTLGIAIHDDFTAARFHHVSLEYRLGFDNAEAEINAVAR